MGRPPLKRGQDTKAFMVRLPQELMDRLSAAVPAKRRSQLIRELIEAELERRERPEQK